MLHINAQALLDLNLAASYFVMFLLHITS